MTEAKTLNLQFQHLILAIAVSFRSSSWLKSYLCSASWCSQQLTWCSQQLNTCQIYVLKLNIRVQLSNFYPFYLISSSLVAHQYISQRISGCLWNRSLSSREMDENLKEFGLTIIAGFNQIRICSIKCYSRKRARSTFNSETQKLDLNPQNHANYYFQIYSASYLSRLKKNSQEQLNKAGRKYFLLKFISYVIFNRQYTNYFLIQLIQQIDCKKNKKRISPLFSLSKKKNLFNLIMLQEQSLNYFQLPTTKSAGQADIVIGILDASGSMSSYWALLAKNYNRLTCNLQYSKTITFSNSAQIFDKQEINGNINNYGGGGTEIEKGFIELNRELNNHTEKDITVIFVSDGADNNNSTLEARLANHQVPKVRSLNFICVGIGKGFPTFISMKLRQLYHTGDECVPPLYLIDPSVQEPKDVKRAEFLEILFAEQFDQLSTQLGHREKIATSPCFQFPWSNETSQEHWSGVWVLSYEPSLKVNGLEVLPIKPNLEDATQIAKYWLQNLQMIGLKKSASQEAVRALEVLQKLAVLGRENKKKLTYAERVKENLFEAPVATLLKEIKNISQGQLLNNLTEAEAAQRLAIGTQVGKYHSKAIQIRGVTVDDYKKDRDAFIEKIKQIKLTEDDTERSVISLQNQKEIFLEEDFIEGLNMTPSQYDLVTMLPVVGYGVLIHRFDGSMINPWIITVKDMAKHHKYIDSLSIYQTPNNIIELQTGEGDIEKLNCVLPLYSEKEKDLGILLQTRLFHYLMTFQVIQNVDTLFTNAFAALMAQCYKFLITKPKSQWRDELMDLILQTYNITYKKYFQDYEAQLITNPAMALVTEHPDIQTKCEDPCKALLVLGHLIREKKVDKEKVREIVDRIVFESLARCSSQPVSDFFDAEIKTDLEKIYGEVIEQIISSVADPLSQFYTIQEIKDYVEQEYRKVKIEIDLGSKPKKEAHDLITGSYNYHVLQCIYSYFLDEQFDDHTFIQAVYHSRLSNSYERAQTPVERDLKVIQAIVVQSLKQQVIASNKIRDICTERLKNQFTSLFRKTHQVAVPIYKIQKQINLADYKVTISDLTSNACLAIECPHFLKIRKDLNQHLKTVNLLPALNKAIKNNLNKSNQEILGMVMRGECLNPGYSGKIITDYSVEELLLAIEKIRAFYLS